MRRNSTPTAGMSTHNAHREGGSGSGGGSDVGGGRGGGGGTRSGGKSKVFKSTYSGIGVYEFICRGVAVMRRRHDSWLNATQLLKVADFDKPQRTRILEREVQTGQHEKIQGGYGKYQGTWVPFHIGVNLARQYKVESSLRPIFEYLSTAVMKLPTTNSSKHMSSFKTDASDNATPFSPIHNQKHIFRYDTSPSASLSPANERKRQRPPKISKMALEQSPLKARNNSMSTTNKRRGYPIAQAHTSCPFTGSNIGPMGLLRDNSLDSSSLTSDSDLSTITSSINENSSSDSEDDRSISKPIVRDKEDDTSGDEMEGNDEDDVASIGSRRLLASPVKKRAKSYHHHHHHQQSNTLGRHRYHKTQRHVAGDDRYPQQYRHPHLERCVPDDIDGEEMMLSVSYADLLLDHFVSDSHQVPKLLLNPPADLDVNLSIDDEGHTPLHWATAMGKMKVLRILLKSGADMNRRNHLGQTALLRSVMFSNNFDNQGFSEILDLLQDSFHLADHNHRSVLHHITLTASCKGKVHAARYYMECLVESIKMDSLQQQPDPNYNVTTSLINMADLQGDTALCIAARIGNKGLVRLLLEIGANLTLKNNDGKSANDYALLLRDPYEGGNINEDVTVDDEDDENDTMAAAFDSRAKAFPSTSTCNASQSGRRNSFAESRKSASSASSSSLRLLARKAGGDGGGGRGGGDDANRSNVLSRVSSNATVNMTFHALGSSASTRVLPALHQFFTKIASDFDAAKTTSELQIKEISEVHETIRREVAETRRIVNNLRTETNHFDWVQERICTLEGQLEKQSWLNQKLVLRLLVMHYESREQQKRRADEDEKSKNSNVSRARTENLPTSQQPKIQQRDASPSEAFAAASVLMPCDPPISYHTAPTPPVTGITTSNVCDLQDFIFETPESLRAVQQLHEVVCRQHLLEQQEKLQQQERRQEDTPFANIGYSADRDDGNPEPRRDDDVVARSQPLLTDSQLTAINELSAFLPSAGDVSSHLTFPNPTIAADVSRSEEVDPSIFPSSDISLASTTLAKNPTPCVSDISSPSTKSSSVSSSSLRSLANSHRHLISALAQTRRSLVRTLVNLKSHSTPRQADYRKLIATCCNVPIESVDALLGPLLQALGAESVSSGSGCAGAGGGFGRSFS